MRSTSGVKMNWPMVAIAGAVIAVPLGVALVQDLGSGRQDPLEAPAALEEQPATIELPEQATVRRAWDAVCAEHPGLERFGASVSFAVNREYADGEASLHDGDEVAFIPPVSGG